MKTNLEESKDATEIKKQISEKIKSKLIDNSSQERSKILFRVKLNLSEKIERIKGSLSKPMRDQIDLFLVGRRNTTSQF